MNQRKWLTFGIASVVCFILVFAGCGDSRPYEDIADYGVFSFGRRSGEKVFYGFQLNLEGTSQVPPSLDVISKSGKEFNCASITIESANKYFSNTFEFEVPAYDKPLHKVSFDDDSASLVFCEGKLESVILRHGGKFRFPDQDEFVSLPLTEKDMKRLFGEPRKYSRVYGLNP